MTEQKNQTDSEIIEILDGHGMYMIKYVREMLDAYLLFSEDKQRKKSVTTYACSLLIDSIMQINDQFSKPCTTYEIIGRYRNDQDFLVEIIPSLRRCIEGYLVYRNDDCPELKMKVYGAYLLLTEFILSIAESSGNPIYTV